MYKVYVFSRFNDEVLGIFSASDVSSLRTCLNHILSVYNLENVYVRFCAIDEKKK